MKNAIFFNSCRNITPFWLLFLIVTLGRSVCTKPFFVYSCFGLCLFCFFWEVYSPMISYGIHQRDHLLSLVLVRCLRRGRRPSCVSGQVRPCKRRHHGRQRHPRLHGSGQVHRQRPVQDGRVRQVQGAGLRRGEAVEPSRCACAGTGDNNFVIVARQRSLCHLMG